MTLDEIVRKLAAEFKGTLTEKGALAAYLENTLKNRPLTDENVEYYNRLAGNYVRGLSKPRSEFG